MSKYELQKDFMTKRINAVYGRLLKDTDVDEKTNENAEPEEWIWVDGYKATKADMTCNGYQYELGKQHDMPEDEEIIECCSGFHLCPRLEDVFNYYKIDKDNRFFKVKALVRKSDYEKSKVRVNYPYTVVYMSDKLTSKSIIFESELTTDEVLTARGIDIREWTDEYKSKAMMMGVESVRNMIEADKLVKMGYSYAFAGYCAKNGLSEIASIAAMEDISMDMKVLLILSNKNW